MTSRTRETLRKYFRVGSSPTEAHFRDMIDSMLNMTDEGFSKTAEHGVKIFTPSGRNSLISFFRESKPNDRQAYITFGAEDDKRTQLLFQVGEDADGGNAEDRVPVLTLEVKTDTDADGAKTLKRHQVGINQQNPQTELDVNGVVRARGRMGGIEPDKPATIIANGQWQDLTGPLQGCRAFEVMAGVGLPQSGKFAMLHAVALNAFNPAESRLRFLANLFFPKKKISQTSSYYSRRCDQIELRWEGDSGRDASYKLQIRTRCAYGDKVRIQCYLTDLWFDPEMKHCEIKVAEAG